MSVKNLNRRQIFLGAGAALVAPILPAQTKLFDPPTIEDLLAMSNARIPGAFKKLRQTGKKVNAAFRQARIKEANRKLQTCDKNYSAISWGECFNLFGSVYSAMVGTIPSSGKKYAQVYNMETGVFTIYKAIITCKKVKKLYEFVESKCKFQLVLTSKRRVNRVRRGRVLVDDNFRVFRPVDPERPWYLSPTETAVSGSQSPWTYLPWIGWMDYTIESSLPEARRDIYRRMWAWDATRRDYRVVDFITVANEFGSVDRNADAAATFQALNTQINLINNQNIGAATGVAIGLSESYNIIDVIDSLDSGVEPSISAILNALFGIIIGGASMVLAYNNIGNYPRTVLLPLENMSGSYLWLRRNGINLEPGDIEMGDLTDASVGSCSTTSA
jgi:hypothetical protein